MPTLRTSTLLVAGPALLTIALAGPASAASHGPSYSVRCTGDTLQLQVSEPGAATARLLAGHDQGHLSATGKTAAVSASGLATFNLAGMGARHYRIEVLNASGVVLGRSPAVPASKCAPGHEVPEAPLSALVPGSLLVTGAALLAHRRRAAVAR